MTSNPISSPYSFIITNAELIQGSLNRPGTVRVDKIYTLDQSLIVKTFGQVNQQTLQQIRSYLCQLTTQSSN